MDNEQSQTDIAHKIIDLGVAHARSMLASQMPKVRSSQFDFMPGFIEMNTQLYLVGVMWRFCEQFELPSATRDRGFICMHSMLVSDGMSDEKAQQRITELLRVSRNVSGQDTLAIAVGYKAEESDGSLAAVLEVFRNDLKMSGAPYRLIDRSKPIAAGLAIVGLLIALLFDRSWTEAIAVGVVLGGGTLAIALALYWQAVKVKGPR